MNFVAHSEDELLAAVPHLLGFRPQESLVVVPLTRGLPITRIDMPVSAADRGRVWEALSGPYGRHATPGSCVAIVGFADDRDAAEQATAHLAGRLDGLGVTPQLRLWTDGQRWCEFDTGRSGPLTSETAELVAVTSVVSGSVQPVASREALAASLVGDPQPIAELLPPARARGVALNGAGLAEEQAWVTSRLQQFQRDGNRLSDVDAARLLVALEAAGTQDALWQDMSRENSASHVALWTDLTRRAPEVVRAAPAGLLGFASWLHGDGAKAWCALDQVPAGERPLMVEIAASALQNGVHPREWEQHKAQIQHLAGELDESYVPDPAERPRDLPTTRNSGGRPTLGR